MSDAPADSAVETTEAAQVTAPVITVTRGNPTREETAVVTVLLAAMSGDRGSTDRNVRRGWSRPSRRLGHGLPGTGWGRAF
ncbi:acyl-CoA carboxylase subunit epsilon [Mobilicoccus pelagius]|uniref:Putative sulfate permease n=1 Tax=Mobilicoccus pelagius NBRC 104925 TaxID=1089455 RepID=H5UN28_9MICO|nr:acyl-CoA carboxylase subunit epsilon [Mobilicoccus pelagius]GAB47136.1 putative sulfate permease [Mobilicoccus pelagius NBRC 104925]